MGKVSLVHMVAVVTMPVQDGVEVVRTEQGDYISGIAELHCKLPRVRSRYGSEAQVGHVVVQAADPHSALPSLADQMGGHAELLLAHPATAAPSHAAGLYRRVEAQEKDSVDIEAAGPVLLRAKPGCAAKGAPTTPLVLDGHVGRCSWRHGRKVVIASDGEETSCFDVTLEHTEHQLIAVTIICQIAGQDDHVGICGPDLVDGLEEAEVGVVAVEPQELCALLAGQRYRAKRLQRSLRTNLHQSPHLPECVIHPPDVTTAGSDHVPIVTHARWVEQPEAEASLGRLSSTSQSCPTLNAPPVELLEVLPLDATSEHESRELTAPQGASRDPLAKPRQVHVGEMSYREGSGHPSSSSRSSSSSAS